MKRNETLKSYAIITFGCILYGLSLDWFYIPNDLTCGGLTGVAQIIHFFVPVLPVGMMVIAMNVPLFVLGFRRFGFGFLVKTLYGMLCSSIMVDVITWIHVFQPMDKMLAGLYGGVIMGIGSGIMMAEEATTGGTELATWLIRRHFPNLSLGNILLGLDLTVILIFAAVFHDFNNALYGGLALFIATKVVDRIVYGGNTGKLAYIISEKEDEITKELLALNVGATKLNAMGAYTRTERQILLCAVRRREIVVVKRLVKEIDPDAFFIMCDAGEVLGEGFGEYDPKAIK